MSPEEALKLARSIADGMIEVDGKPRWIVVAQRREEKPSHV
jgi:hypothetical protein